MCRDIIIDIPEKYPILPSQVQTQSFKQELYRFLYDEEWDNETQGERKLLHDNFNIST